MGWENVGDMGADVQGWERERMLHQRQADMQKSRSCRMHGETQQFFAIISESTGVRSSVNRRYRLRPRRTPDDRHIHVVVSHSFDPYKNPGRR